MRNKRAKGKIMSLVMAFAMSLSVLGGVTGSTLQVKAAATVSNPRIAEDGTVTWDKITFGSYPQDAEFTPEPIKWRILDIDSEGNAFLLADEALDCKPYNDTYADCTWETCKLHDWLNGTGAYENNNDALINAAFTDEERADIIDAEYSMGGDNNIADKIYLLSTEEASNPDYGFDDDDGNDSATRHAKATDYAKFNGAYVHKRSVIEGNCNWWLRSSGNNNYGAAYVLNGWVDDNGGGNDDGYPINGNAVRPALHVKLSSSYVSDAGKVKSDGTIVEPSNRKSVYEFSKPTTLEDVTTWDCVYFGNYKQKAVFKEKQPIEWRVLSVTGDDAFVVADKALDCKPYNTSYKTCTWETSTLRDWLNGIDSYNNNDAFINMAFTDEEKKAIIETIVENADNKNGMEGGSDTKDKIYLLSMAEATITAYGFSEEFGSSAARQAKATDYAKINGAYIYKSSITTIKKTYHSVGNCYWWLRSYAYDTAKANSNNGVGPGGDGAADNVYDLFAVRPALHVNLSSSNVKAIGTVSAKVTVTADIEAQIKVNNVLSLISAIGTVTKDSKTAIDTARSAYEALSETGKAKVTNYGVLQEAESKYAELTKSGSGKDNDNGKENKGNGGNADNASDGSTGSNTGTTPETTEEPATTETVNTPTITETPKDALTTFNIKNKKTYKKSQKVIIKDKDGIKSVVLNKKKIKVKKGKKTVSFKLSSYKKSHKKKNKWNKIIVIDVNGNKKTIQFKTK